MKILRHYKEDAANEDENLILSFAFYSPSIPRLDTYLAEKYGKEFEEYAKRTKKFIPGIY